MNVLTKQGFSITFADNDHSVGANLRRGEHEPHTCDLISSLLKPGMFVVIGGSNYGVFDVLCARLVGSTGMVIGFEPNPAVWPYWEENVKQNCVGEICQLVKLALSDSVGPMTLYTDSDDSDLGGVTAFAGGSRNTLIGVSATSLDCFTFRSIDLLKLDIEGCERFAIKGAEYTIRDYPPRWIITEYRRQDDAHARAYICRLLNRGYSMQRIRTDTSPQMPITPEELPATIHSELLFTMERN